MLEVVWSRGWANTTFHRSLQSFYCAKCQQMVKAFFFYLWLTLVRFVSWDPVFSFCILSDLDLEDLDLNVMGLVRAELRPVQPYHGDLLVAVEQTVELLLVLG